MAEAALDVNQVKKQRIIYLALSTTVLLFLGLIYAFSMFALPMTQDFGLEGNIALTFNIMMITFCVGSVVGSLLDRKFGIRPSLIISAVMFAIGFCGAGIIGASTHDVVMLYIFYGVIGGFSVGIGYNTIIATTNVWFPDKVGFSSGVLMMGFGLSSLIFGNIALALRPAFGGMSMVLTILGCIVAALTLVLAFVLKKAPTDISQILLGTRKQGASQLSQGEGENLLKTPIFYLYYVWAIIVIAIGLATIGNCAADATKVGIDAGFAVILVGLVSTCNGLSRIAIGILFDKTNIKLTMLIDCIIAATATILIVAAFASSSPMLYIPGALLCGVAYGGVPVIASAFSRQRYGCEKYPFNLSVCNFAIAFGSFLNIAVAAIVGADGRMTIFMVMMVLSFVALGSVFAFSKQWDKDLAEQEKAVAQEENDAAFSCGTVQ